MPVSSSMTPISRDHPFDRFCERRSFRPRQVRLFVLGEDCEQENRYIFLIEEIDHSRATALAASAEGKAHFPNAAGIRNQHATLGIGCDTIYDGYPLLSRKEAFRV